MQNGNQTSLKVAIEYTCILLLFTMRVVVKMAEWWLGPTTSDQCGQNPAFVIY